jgi:hypothetical protein
MEDLSLEQNFLSVDKAFDQAITKAIKKNKDLGSDINSAYINRQRYNKGKLSYKKIVEILEEQGFKKVVEEKWILINKETLAKIPPGISSRAMDYTTNRAKRETRDQDSVMIPQRPKKRSKRT